MAGETAQPRLYLDVDGVLLAKQPPFAETREYDGFRYAPEVIQRLGNTGMELVWLSTWGREATRSLEPEFDELQSGRVLLPPPNVRPEAIRWKTAALLADQFASPSPFVWAEDRISNPQRQMTRYFFTLPHLLVRPLTVNGITPEQLTTIETFARNNKKPRSFW